MEIRKEFLLGVNNIENKIYLGEINLTHRNGYPEFTACFDVGEAFDIEDINEEYTQEYFNNLWECVDAETKINWLDDGEMTRQEVFESWDTGDYRDIKDCSCTDYETTLNNGQTINFGTTCCGQHDIRENIEEFKNIIFTDKKAVLLILELWDKYHLKNVKNNIKEVETKINKIINRIDKYNTYEYTTIENFIKEHIKEI